MKIFKRLISLITVFSIIAAFSLNVNATTIPSTINKSDVKIDSSDYTLDNLPSYLLETIQSNDKEVESLDLENILDEFAIITNNKDGSKTHYRFDVPIKYKNQDKISFRNPKIERSNLIKRTFTKHEYESVKNDFKSYFPKKLQDGILMEYKDYSVKISSINNLEYSSNNILVNTKENAAKYTNVFSAKDHVEYIPIVNGLKENIVLNEYTGQNTFKFKITIDGLIPAFMEGESIPLLDKVSNELVMAIGQVDAKDSYVGQNENNDTHFSLYNKLILEKTEKDSEYELTVVVDKEFLESETTVYPVIIDPTINVTDTSLMRDTTVYSAKPTSQTFYTSSYNIVGNHGSSYGEGIPFIQVLTMHCYKHINPNNITSAYYHVREGSGKTNSSVIEIHDTYSPWEENTITYNNMPGTSNYDSSKNVTVTTSKWYDFNITGLVKAWLRTELSEGGWNQTYGFALKAQNSSASSKHFCSANHGTYPPSMIINYNEDSSVSNGVYYIKNVWTGKYLDVENPVLNSGSGTVNVIVYQFNGNYNQQWQVERQSNGYYKLYSQWGFSSPKCLDITGDNIDVYDSNSNGEYLLFRIVSNNDGTHRIMPVCNDNTFRALDVNGSSDSADYQRNVISYAYWANTNQKWIFEPTNQDPKVADMSIYSNSSSGSSGINITGHAFITIKNTSNVPIYVGPFKIGPSNMITIGTWGNMGFNGIWYNLESTWTDSTSYTEAAMLITDIKRSQISTINSNLSSNNTWSELNNCSSFAVRLWNQVSAVSLSAGIINTPENLKNNIKTKTGWTNGVFIDSISPIGFCNSNGEFIDVTPQ